MGDLARLLWEYTWGKAILIGLGLVAILGFYLLLRDEKRDEKVGDGLLSSLADLEMQWPFFSALAIERRVRTFCEKFFLRWNRQTLAGIEAYCTPEAFDELQDSLNTKLALGEYEPVKVEAFWQPKIYQIVTPKASSPPMVSVLACVLTPNAMKKDGLDKNKMIVSLIYAQSGDWLVQSIEYGDFELRDSPPSDLDTTWMQTAAMPQPSAAVLYPEKPRSKARNGKLSGGLVFLLLFCLAAAGATSYMFHLDKKWEQRNAHLRQDGERLFAEIQSHEHDETYKKYRFQYSFQPPGSSETYTYTGNATHGNMAEVDEATGAAAVERGTLEVAYNPDDPAVNCAVARHDRSSGDSNAALVVVIILPLIGAIVCLCLICARLKPDFSEFWVGWDKKARRRRRLPSAAR